VRAGRWTGEDLTQDQAFEAVKTSKMRVILIGDDGERARLRNRVSEGVTVVGEFATVADARAAGIEADAYLTAADSPRARPLPVDHAIVDALTPREIEVLQFLADGLPNKAIAARLGISDQTVKFHVASITGKLGVANRTEAVRRAFQRGLIAV
jgi:DNA-binding NarL/FixJ family response regulator